MLENAIGYPAFFPPTNNKLVDKKTIKIHTIFRWYNSLMLKASPWTIQ